MSHLPILIVEDEAHARVSLATTLVGLGYSEPVGCGSLAEARNRLAEGGLSLVLLDLHLGDGNGETLLGEIAVRYPDVPVIVVTAMQDVATAVRCMRSHAADYLVKPIDLLALEVAVRRTLETATLARENRALTGMSRPTILGHPEAFAGMVTFDPAMLRLMQYAEIIAGNDLPILISGEGGTGKHLLANAIHRLSGCRGPCAELSVAGLSADAILDRLLGTTTRVGLLRDAASGTLILDDLEQLPDAVQVEILRLIQTHRYRVGGLGPATDCTTRFVMLANRDPDDLLAGQRLRADLHHRLQAHRLDLPPLRHRRGDLPILVHHLVAQAAQAQGRPPAPVSETFLRQCQTHTWPGNIRQLREAIDQTTASGQPLALTGAPSRTPLPDDQVILPRNLPTLDEMRDLLIAEAVHRTGGNISEASRILGISRWGLTKRLKNQA
jgi:DNA-binding NtrC family response regulator